MATPPTRPRTRMGVDARRDQLLHVAGELFAHQPYPAVHLEKIAARAGVSLGLIYHYFDDKQALFAAVVDKAIEELAQATEPDPALDPLDRARAAIDGYLDYTERNEHAYRTMHRGTQSGDARIHAALERNTRRQIDRICHALLGTPDGPPKLRLAIRGWLGFVIATCLDWLDNHQITRDELRTLHLHALASALTSAYAHDEPDDPTPGLTTSAPATIPTHAT
jgi:AcrR family transcriptional regulator